MKKCPFCAEEIQDEAIKCRHCGSLLSHAAPSGGNGGDDLDRSATISAEAIRPGVLLAGRYLVRQRLGAGGMGEVWLADDNEIDDLHVALKVLPGLLARSGQAVNALRREAAIALRLTHPYICRLHYFHSDGDVKFLVMEHLEGKTLEDVLRDSDAGSFGVGEVTEMFGPMAEALDYAHRLTPPILHRDLKPSNVMISPRGEAKLMDFGIAREIKDTMTRISTTTSMTPLYASPEQFRGQPMGPASDLYSLAAVLYECLAGRPYVSAHGDLAWQILQRPYPPVESLTAPANAALEAGLAKSPRDRLDSAVQLLRQLGGKVPPSIPAAPKAPARDKAMPIEMALDSLTTPPPTPPGPPAPPTPPAQARAGFPMSPDQAAEVQQKAAQAAGIGVHTTLDLGQGAELALTLLPPGEFLMGCRLAPDEVVRRLGGEHAWYAREHPRHHVALSRAMQMGTVPVTRGQFAAFVAETGYLTEAQREGWSFAWSGLQWDRMGGIFWQHTGFEQDDSHPVTCVSWQDAMAFCAWVANRTGLDVRLPTEAQWEYACRAGSDTLFPWGDAPDAGAGWANAADRTTKKAYPSLNAFHWSSGYVHTSPVGTFGPNAFGLRDMIGNTWEWCQDWLQDNYYAAGAATDPPGPASGQYRVIRGGSWCDDPATCRCARRGWGQPGNRGVRLGFRIAVLLSSRA